MPKYVLTGVGGDLGGVAANYLLDFAAPTDQIVLTSSRLSTISPETIKTWTMKGASVLSANYEDLPSLEAVFTGAAAVAMISTWAFGEGRRRQARNVVQSAKACGVPRICYSSFVGADSTETEEDMPFLPRDHRYTERLLLDSGLCYNIQRNNLYADNIPTLFMPAWESCGNRWLSNSHRVPAAYVAREDCGRVLAALLLGRADPNTIWPVTGPEAVTDEEVLNWVKAHVDCDPETRFVDLPDAELKEYWVGRGISTDTTSESSQRPSQLCLDDLLGCGDVVARGLMKKTTSTVETLTGLKPISFQEAILKYKKV